MPRQVKPVIVLITLVVISPPAFAGSKDVAVVNNVNGDGVGWCTLLVNNGDMCTLFPKEGPTASLKPFDVVIDMSDVWTDPAESLADFLRAGRTVITAKDAPAALGIESNPTVQAWIGAGASAAGPLDLVTVASDPILGDIPPGTFITDCGAGACLALSDLGPGAKVLAAFPDGGAGIMRNIWEGSVTVFITDNISPGSTNGSKIILNAVRARELTIPTVSHWGLLVMALALVACGSIIAAKRRIQESAIGKPER
jgi:hypothetical protein